MIKEQIASTDLKMTKKPIYILAPMDDVTDTVFRRMIISTSPPDEFFTEFVNVDGLQSPGRDQVIKKLKFTKIELPLIAQVWGRIPENYEKTAKEIVDMGFSGIDINMGCPVKTVTKNGCCSALISNRQLAAEIIDATKKGANGKLPVSVKTRLGQNSIDYSWIEFLLEQGIDRLTIHARTVKEMSKVPAHWEVMGDIVKLRDKISPSTQIILNGDIKNRTQGDELAKKYKLDGIMIGRGIFEDPFLFGGKDTWQKYSKEEKIRLFMEHIKLFDITWGKSRRVHVLNKFCKIYIEGFNGAKEFREKLMAANTVDELLNILNDSLIQ
ncbi:MAG: tRNA-dihydrouridine synthase [Candidatus Saccharibacteria bacterium]